MVKVSLEKLSLNKDNSIVIGSGILQALGIRKSKDIDVVVTSEVFNSLKKSGKFKSFLAFGGEVLKNDLFEIGTEWNVLGKRHTFNDLRVNSVVIDEVRYVTLEFLLKVKESWLKDRVVRKKDIEDVKLITQFLRAK